MEMYISQCRLHISHSQAEVNSVPYKLSDSLLDYVPCNISEVKTSHDFIETFRILSPGLPAKNLAKHAASPKEF